MKELLFPIGINLVLGALLLPLLLWKRRPDAQRLESPERALEIYRRFFPDAEGRASLTLDGRAALIDTALGEIGLLVREGRRWKARVLSARDVRAARWHSGTLELRFTDFGWARARLAFGEAAGSSWAQRLEAALRAARSSAELGHA